MVTNILPIASLLFSAFLMLMAGGLSGYLLPLRAVAEGWSTLTISMMATGYAVAFTAGCLLTPRLVLRVGHVRVFSVLATLMSISLLLHALVIHPVAWIAFRAVAGFSIAGGYMVIESWLNERVTNETRGGVFSVYMTISMLGLMIGQFTVPLGDMMTASLFIVSAIVYSFAVIPTGLSSAQSPQPLSQVKLDIRKLFRNSPASVVGAILAGAIASSWSNLGPVYSQQNGLTTTEGAAMLAAAMIGGAVFQIPLGRASDRMDRRYVMIFAGLVGLTLSLAAALLGADNRLVFFTAMFLLGSVLFPIYSLNVAHANDHADPDAFVEVSSGLLIIYGFGTMAGPIVTGGVMDLIGPSALFMTIAGAFALYALYAFYRTTRRPMPSADDRSDFRAIPFGTGETPQTYELDPRVDMAAEQEGAVADR
ncbi:MFS transporter [Pararhizobium haloflavum]|uniref:MFS transporter n=1 Tax=Pararhizobium haloflavum TaxID=2037914 RepID=UPI000C1907C9|nr:MFS transporter [Pararhizobium haloflavum]